VSSTTRWAGDAGSDGGADAGCSQAGTDFAASTLGSLAIGDYNLPAGYVGSIPLDMTELGNMVAANYGSVIFTNATPGNDPASSDHATAGYRPKLVVDYTEGGATVKPWYVLGWQ
jgi:hypothetical protein